MYKRLLTLIVAVSFVTGCNSLYPKLKPEKANFRAPANEESESHTHYCPTGRWENKLVIHHISVGQGDSTLIRSPKGTMLLIDVGVSQSVAQNDVMAVLERCYKTNTVDYLMISHFDSDHYGGAPWILTEGGLKVRKSIFDPGYPHENKNQSKGSLFYRYLKAVKKAKVKRKVPKLGKGSIDFDDVEVVITSVGGKIPTSRKNMRPKTIRGTDDDSNSRSISLLLRYGNFDYFTAGDLTGGGGSTPKVEQALAPLLGDIDMYRANHHGSDTSSSIELLKILKPEFVVISVGEQPITKKFRHPSASVMTLFHKSPDIQYILQTGHGFTDAPKSHLEKVVHNRGDVVVMTTKKTFRITRANRTFRNDGR